MAKIYYNHAQSWSPAGHGLCHAASPFKKMHLGKVAASGIGRFGAAVRQHPVEISRVSLSHFWNIAGLSAAERSESPADSGKYEQSVRVAVRCQKE